MTVLYHASPSIDLEVIHPKRTISKDKYIGDFVFATSDKILATMYLANRGYATLMNSKEEQPNIVICGDATTYQADDVGGAIYELPVEFFTETPQVDLSEFEFVSNNPVKPVGKSIYKKSLGAMKEAGIVVRFVDKTIFDNLIGNPKQAELISKLPVFKY